MIQKIYEIRDDDTVKRNLYGTRFFAKLDDAKAVYREMTDDDKSSFKSEPYDEGSDGEPMAWFFEYSSIVIIERKLE